MPISAEASVPVARFDRLSKPRPQALEALVLSLDGKTEGEVRSALACEAPWYEATNAEIAQIVSGRL